MVNNDYAGKFKLQEASLSGGGKTTNIANIIKGFEIRESINLMFAIYRFQVLDAITLLESSEATGSETMSISLTMDDNDDKLKTIELVVIGYDSYSRPSNQSHSYTITAIRKTAYLAAIKRVSRDVRGSGCSVLQSLYSDIDKDGGINTKDANDEGNFRGIIPNLTYQESFNYLLSKSATSNGGTFFFFETLWDGQVLTSYKSMIAESPARSYKITDDADTSNGLQKDTIEKIKTISSNIGMSTYRSFKGGGTTARSHTIDLSTKVYDVEFFDFTTLGLPKMREQYTVGKSFNVAPLADTEGMTYLFNRNTLTYDNAYVNFNDNAQVSVPRKKAILENIYAMQHTIDVAGVEDLACGKTVEMTIQQATDATVVDIHVDTMLSGVYLITELTHNFKWNGTYYVTCNIKRDSFLNDNPGGLF
jgi:hypothetical protein